MRNLILTVFTSLVTVLTVFAQQGVSITTDGTPPDFSAILDVKSTNRGMLVPRMTQVQRNAITAPATGLLIYQTNNTPGFYYYNGAVWTALTVAPDNLGNHTATTNLNLGANSITNAANITATGTATLGGNAYPTVTGTNGQVLTTNGAGIASWANAAGEATTVSNGLTLTGVNATLGGDLTGNTTITQDNAEALRINNNSTVGTIIDLQNTGDLRVLDNGVGAFQVLDDGRVLIGSTNQFVINNAGNITRLNNVVTSFPATQGAAGTFLNNDGAGNLDWIAAPTFTDATTASNGVTLTGSDVRLGGALTGTTTITQDNAEALRINNNATAGTVIDLQSTGDFRVFDNGTNAFQVLDDGRVVIGTASQLSINNVGNITRLNNVVTNFPNAQGAAGTFLSNDGAGNLDWVAPTFTDATTASNGLILTGSDVRLGGALTATTTVTQDNAEVLRFDNNGTANTVIDLQSTGDFRVLDNGVNALQVLDDGRVQIGTANQLVFNGTGNITRLNNVVTSFPAVQGAAGTVLENDGAGNLSWAVPSTPADATTASNGLTLTGNDVRLGGTLTASTTVTQSGANTLTFSNNSTVPTTINLTSTGDFLVQDNGANALTVQNNGTVTMGSTGQMQVGNTGNFVRINNVPTSFPAAQGAAGHALTNDGSGNLSWTNVNATNWSTLGNNITAGTHFLGSTNDAALTFRVNNSPAGFIGNSTSYNTMFGYQAGMSMTTGDGNTFMGREAGYHNTAGGANIAIGQGALYYNTHGNYNTSIGINTLTNSQGIFNIAVGTDAGSSLGIGDYNIFVGGQSATSTLARQWGIAIGTLAVCDADNRIRIGSGLYTSIGGPVAWTNFSDKRFKFNVEHDVQGLDLIMKLNPVTYQFDYDALHKFYQNTNPEIGDAPYSTATEMRQIGFMAQEIDSLCQAMGFDFGAVDKPTDENSGIYGLRYTAFVPVLVKAMQEQQVEITVLNQQNQVVAAENSALKARFAEVDAKLNELETLKAEILQIKQTMPLLQVSNDQ